MAYHYNYKFWLTTANLINELVMKQPAFAQMKPTQDKHVAHDIFAIIYSRYVLLVNRLSYLFDITCQVQKRKLIQRLLEAATNRVLEVRNEIKQIELSEYIYLDNALIKMKLLLEDVQLLRPFYYPKTRDSEIQNLIDNKVRRESAEIFGSILRTDSKQTNIGRPSKVRAARKSVLMRVLEETDLEQYKRLMATTLIKIHDKARRSRVLFMNIKYHPEQYKPQAPFIDQGLSYGYTHKPDQSMLIQVKRTTYNSSYITNWEEAEQFIYYLRPVHRQLKFREISTKESSEANSTDNECIHVEEDEELLFDGEGRDFTLEKSSVSSSIISHPTLSLRELKEEMLASDSIAALNAVAAAIQQREQITEHENVKTEMAESYVFGMPANDAKYLQRRSTVRLIVPLDDKRSSTVLGGTKSSAQLEQPPASASSNTEETALSIKGSGTLEWKSGVASHKGIFREKEDMFTLKHNLVAMENQGTSGSLLSLLTNRLRNKAASTIQAAWKRYLLKRRIQKRRLEKLVLYGMISEWKWDKKLDKEIEADRQKLRNRKTIFDKHFIQVCQDEKNRILKVRGPYIMEDISDHIRAWFREFYDVTGEFDRYPEEFEGGTILVIRGETMTPQEYVLDKIERKHKKKKTPEQKKKEQEQRKAEKEKLKLQKKKEKQLAKAQKLLEAKNGKTYDFATEPKFVADLRETMEEYTTEWANIDERNNINEDPYMEWITSDKFAEVHQELRLVVDELMRVEFEMLRKALAEDRKKKYKPQKKRKQKKKKGGKGGRRKKKQSKDITGDRTTNSLYFELQDAGLIKRFPPEKLDAYIGEYNYSAYEKRFIHMLDPPPGQGEIKDVIREAIIGMGPLNFPKVKSLCLMGPPRSGKKFLAHAIATEIDAVMIDISPEKVVQFEENMKYFIHLVNKMARVLQPAILFINQCERIFWKKVPKDQTDLKPRLLGKYIIKQIVKSIKREDKILVVGITDEPFKAKLAKMKKCFEKIVLIPRADYGTTYALNRCLALNKYGVPRDFDFSAVSMVTKGFSSSLIYDNVNEALNIERRMTLQHNPLKAEELIEGFLDREVSIFPITDDEFAKYTKFYSKVNKLAKQRAKFMKQLEQAKSKEKPKRK